jgi:hypothetical protein
MNLSSDEMSALYRPGACTHCKKLKIKCDFSLDAAVCKRCKNSGHHCVVEGRKPRSGAT